MNSFFAGANSAQGFVNYFEELCAPYRTYILKGGSGCGKSSFMKSIAQSAEARGDSVLRIYCASDSDSLDGIILPSRGVAVVDGTAPHSLEPRLAGAVDSIIDLGDCWDSAALAVHREEIAQEAELKAGCYRRAYALLSGAGRLREAAFDIRKRALKQEKLAAFAARRARSLPKTPLKATHMARQAFNGEGICGFDCGGMAVYDRFDMADMFFAALISALGGNGGAVWASHDPLDTRRLDGLFFANGEGFYKSERREDTCINMERFVDRAVLASARNKLRVIEKAKAALLTSAQSELAEARRHHQALEAIYTPTVNFSAVDKRRAALEKSIFAE